MIALCAGLFVAALCSQAQAPPAVPVPPKPPVKEVLKSPETSPPRAQVSTTPKQPTGVFVLPMTGFIGLEVTPRQLNDLVDEADKAGAGQIIVLEVNSQGGLRDTATWFAKTLEKIRQRHKVVVLVKRAINWSALLALMGHETYMTPGSALGHASPTIPDCTGTNWAAVRSEWMAFASRAGHPPELVSAMMTPSGCWYRKREDSDKIEFYVKEPVPEDAVQLCQEKDTLVLTPESALACGAIRGIAADEAALAKLLGLPEWKELSDKGRKRAEEWRALVKNCEESIQRLTKELGTLRNDESAASIQRQVEICEELLGWVKKCRECTELNGFDRDTLQWRLKELSGKKPKV